MRNLIYYYSFLQYLIQDSIFVTGTKKLFGDALVALQIILIPIVCAAWVWLQLQKTVGEDNDQEKNSKKQKLLIIGLIIAELIGSLIGTIGGYYGIHIK